MEAIAFITGIVAISVIFYYILKEYSYAQFQNKMKQLDECMIIINNHKVYGTIENIFDTEVVWVKTIHGIYAVNKTEVYPSKTIII